MNAVAEDEQKRADAVRREWEEEMARRRARIEWLASLSAGDEVAVVRGNPATELGGTVVVGILTVVRRTPSGQIVVSGHESRFTPDGSVVGERDSWGTRLVRPSDDHRRHIAERKAAAARAADPEEKARRELAYKRRVFISDLEDAQNSLRGAASRAPEEALSAPLLAQAEQLGAEIARLRELWGVR